MAISDNWMQSNSGIVPIANGVGTISKNSSNNVVVIDNQAYRVYTVVVHTFKILNFDDPVLEASEELIKWEKSEQGQWVMTHAVDTPVWHKQENFALYCVDFRITAKLLEKHYTFWQLKWNSK